MERAPKSAFSGNAADSVSALTGQHRALIDGKVSDASGKQLPLSVPEKPELERIVQELNVVSESIGRDLRFQVDLDRGHAVIQVLDRETGEIIRQIPPEKVAAHVAQNGALALRLYDESI